MKGRIHSLKSRLQISESRKKAIEEAGRIQSGNERQNESIGKETRRKSQTIRGSIQIKSELLGTDCSTQGGELGLGHSISQPFSYFFRLSETIKGSFQGRPNTCSLLAWPFSRPEINWLPEANSKHLAGKKTVDLVQ